MITFEVKFKKKNLNFFIIFFLIFIKITLKTRKKTKKIFLTNRIIKGVLEGGKKKEKKFLNLLDILWVLLYYISCVQSRCSAVGSVRGLGPWGRGFESLHLDH